MTSNFGQERAPFVLAIACHIASCVFKEQSSRKRLMDLGISPEGRFISCSLALHEYFATNVSIPFGISVQQQGKEKAKPPPPPPTHPPAPPNIIVEQLTERERDPSDFFSVSLLLLQGCGGGGRRCVARVKRVITLAGLSQLLWTITYV